MKKSRKESAANRIAWINLVCSNTMHRVNFGHNGTLSLPLKCPTCVTIKNVRDLNVRLIWLDLNRGAMLINHGHLIHET